jgi:hypothetical protein
MYLPNTVNNKKNIQSGIYEQPKEDKNKQNSIYNKIKDPYYNLKKINSTAIPMPMPSVYTMVPPYAQNPIPIIPNTQIPIVQMPTPYGPPLYAPYQPNINKKYDVRISTGDLSNIKHIYQDRLPKKDSNFPDRYATITERVNIANYYNLILKKYYNVYDNTTIINDIENKNIRTTTNNLSHLFNHIKIIDTDFLNILNDATENFIIFNVCFPIKYDNYHITCADENLRAHLRIYNILNNEDNNRKIYNDINYYNKINELIKNKINPNFVLSYGTFVTPLKFDFKTINELTKKTNLSKIQNQTNGNGNCLLILTESVNYTIKNWVTKKYGDSKSSIVPDINIIPIISTGTHSQETYKSVLFQLLVAIYFLQINNFNFTNFSLQNVFIKTIDITPPNIKYWKYIINGIEYYVPNHGFLVMIDKQFDSEFNSGKLDTNTILQEIKQFIDDNHISINDFEINDKIITLINKHFGSYIYEKVGHIIPASNIEKNEYKLFKYNKNFIPGELVLFTKSTDIYIISTYLGKKNKTNNIHEINTNNSEFNNYKEDNINLEVVEVSDDLIIKFHYKSQKEIIETYHIS